MRTLRADLPRADLAKILQTQPFDLYAGLHEQIYIWFIQNDWSSAQTGATRCSGLFDIVDYNGSTRKRPVQPFFLEQYLQRLTSESENAAAGGAPSTSMAAGSSTTAWATSPGGGDALRFLRVDGAVRQGRAQVLDGRHRAALAAARRSDRIHAEGHRDPATLHHNGCARLGQCPGRSVGEHGDPGRGESVAEVPHRGSAAARCGQRARLGGPPTTSPAPARLCALGPTLPTSLTACCWWRRSSTASSAAAADQAAAAAPVRLRGC